NQWSGGCSAFDTPENAVRFGLIAAGTTIVGATIGVSALIVGGYADSSPLSSNWTTWCFGNLAAAVLVTPVVVLWKRQSMSLLDRSEVIRAVSVFAAAIIAGSVAFGPELGQFASKGALAFFSIPPVVWAVIRCNQRDTATVALILSGFAAWGMASNVGPFAGTD